MRFTARVKRRAIWSTVAVLAVAGAIAAVALSQADEAVPAASSTTKVQRGTVTLAVAAAGTIQSAQTRGLSFSTAGTVTELDVKAGDTVVAGQVLARIDPGDAQDAVTSAQSRVNDAQDAVDRAVTAANLPPCPTATPARTTAAAVRTTAAPTPPVTHSASPSASTSHATKAALVAGADAAVDPGTGAGSGSGGGSGSGSGGGSGAGGGQSNCASSTRVSTTDSLLSAQQQLNNARLTLTQANARLAGTTITAPIAGKVLSVGGKVGANASPGGTGFVVLGDVSNLTVTALFSEADVGRLAVGQTSTIALPDRAAEFPGKVSQIDPAGTVSSRLVKYGVVIAFDAVPPDLLLGQSATVTVTTASVDDVLYVSSAAVTGVSGGASTPATPGDASAGPVTLTGTVTVRADGRDSSRTVTIGLRGDQYTEVKSGLVEGDEVVLPSSA